MRAIGDRVRHLRQQNDLSQDGLAEAAGMHRTYIGHLERGTINPSWQTLLAIARALKMDVGEMVAGLCGDPERQ